MLAEISYQFGIFSSQILYEQMVSRMLSVVDNVKIPEDHTQKRTRFSRNVMDTKWICTLCNIFMQQ